MSFSKYNGLKATPWSDAVRRTENIYLNLSIYSLLTVYSIDPRLGSWTSITPCLLSWGHDHGMHALHQPDSAAWCGWARRSRQSRSPEDCIASGEQFVTLYLGGYLAGLQALFYVAETWPLLDSTPFALCRAPSNRLSDQASRFPIQWLHWGHPGLENPVSFAEGLKLVLCTLEGSHWKEPFRKPELIL